MMNNDSIFVDARLLTAFCAAAEELHFGRAAARIFMTQPPFSQLIKRLEEQVGTPLFVRTTRSVRLTPAGQVMHERARQIAGDTATMLSATLKAARGEAGSLVIGLTPSASCSPLADALYHFRLSRPEISLDLREMNSNVMEAAIRNRTLDLALMRPTQMDADIHTSEVFREPMLLAIRKDHPWASRQRVPVEDITSIALVGYLENTSPYFRGMLKTIFSHIKKRPNIVQESMLPTLLTLVEAGVGAAIVPWTISRTRDNSLTFLPLLDRSQTMASIVAARLARHTNGAIDGLLSSIKRRTP